MPAHTLELFAEPLHEEASVEHVGQRVGMRHPLHFLVGFFQSVLGSATFAEHFFATAARLLREGGVFTYLSNEVDSLSRAHQRALFRHFSRLAASVVPLSVPADVKDTWWADTMVAVEVTK